jgi:hypothetical protein
MTMAQILNMLRWVSFIPVNNYIYWASEISCDTQCSVHSVLKVYHKCLPLQNNMAQIWIPESVVTRSNPTSFAICYGWSPNVEVLLVFAIYTWYWENRFFFCIVRSLRTHARRLKINRETSQCLSKKTMVSIPKSVHLQEYRLSQHSFGQE